MASESGDSRVSSALPSREQSPAPHAAAAASTAAAGGGGKKAAAAAAGSDSSAAPPKHTGSHASKPPRMPPSAPMSRSRSTPDQHNSSSTRSPSMSPQPSPSPSPTVVRSLPSSGGTALPAAWSFYLDDCNLWGVKSVAECLEKMGYLGTVDTIQSFWRLFNALDNMLLTEAKLGTNSQGGSIGGTPVASPRQGSIGASAASAPGPASNGNGRYNWRVFDSLITPVWEDDTHALGGKFVLRCGSGELRNTKFIWTKLVLSMVGANLLHQESVCGCVLACRPHKKEVQIWIKRPPPKRAAPVAAVGTSASTLPSPPTLPPAAADADSQSSSAAPAASSLAVTVPPPSHSCTCHIDPLGCFANDLRFLLGLQLAPVANPAAVANADGSLSPERAAQPPAAPATPGGKRPPPIAKIDWIPHDETMAEVDKRNKRVSKNRSRQAAAAASSPATSSSSNGGQLTEQQIKAAKAERERKRASESKAQQAQIAQANKNKTLSSTTASSAAGAEMSPSPSPSPPPAASTGPAPIALGNPALVLPAPNSAAAASAVSKKSPLLSTTQQHSKNSSSFSAPGSAASPSLSSLSSSNKGSSRWADALDSYEDDTLDAGGFATPGGAHSRAMSLDLNSDDYATSTTTSAASSVANTPVITGRSLMHPGSPSSKGLGAGSNTATVAPKAKQPPSSHHPNASSGDQTQAVLSHLEQMVARDKSTFEGSAGEFGRERTTTSAVQMRPPTLRNPAAVQLLRKGAMPLKVSSGERTFHPEPDSPGMNGTPMPSPSPTPLNGPMSVAGYMSASGSPPTPRSPFLAHSPTNASRSGGYMSFGHKAHLVHENGTRGSRAPSQQMESPLPSPRSRAQAAAESEEENAAIQRTRDLLRTPLDLDSLSLPAAQTQRLQDPTARSAPERAASAAPDLARRSPSPLSHSRSPTGAGSGLLPNGKRPSILSMVSPPTLPSPEPEPVPVSNLQELSRVLAAKQGSKKKQAKWASVKGDVAGAAAAPADATVAAAAVPTVSAPIDEDDDATAGAGDDTAATTAAAAAAAADSSEAQQSPTAPRNSPSARRSRASAPAPPPVVAPKKRHKNAKRGGAADEHPSDQPAGLLSAVLPLPLRRGVKARSLRLYALYALLLVLGLVAAYLLFFTTLAPDADAEFLRQPSATSTAGAKARAPKTYATKR